MSPTVDDTMVAIRNIYNTVLKSTPSATIFGRDVLSNIPYVADWNKMDVVDKNRWNALVNARSLIVYPITMQNMRGLTR